MCRASFSSFARQSPSEGTVIDVRLRISRPRNQVKRGSRKKSPSQPSTPRTAGGDIRGRAGKGLHVLVGSPLSYPRSGRCAKPCPELLVVAETHERFCECTQVADGNHEPSHFILNEISHGPAGLRDHGRLAA